VDKTHSAEQEIARWLGLKGRPGEPAPAAKTRLWPVFGFAVIGSIVVAYGVLRAAHQLAAFLQRAMR
jgi:hypothetical protein